MMVSDDDVKRKLIQENPYTTFQFDDEEVLGRTLTDFEEEDPPTVMVESPETAPEAVTAEQVEEEGEKIDAEINDLVTTYGIGLGFPSSWFQQISIGSFTKGLTFADLWHNHLMLVVFVVVFTTLAWLGLKKQEA